MRLCEQTKIVPMLEPEDHAAGADCDSVSLENYSHLTLIFTFGELTGDAVLTVNSGASAGTKTTAETFNYRATSADLKNASGDALGSESTSAGLTLTAATYEDHGCNLRGSHACRRDGCGRVHGRSAVDYAVFEFGCV